MIDYKLKVEDTGDRLWVQHCGKYYALMVKCKGCRKWWIVAQIKIGEESHFERDGIQPLAWWERYRPLFRALLNG